MVKLPPNVKTFEVDVKLPALIVRLFRETALLAKLSVPAPNFVRLEADEIVPPMVSVLADTVMFLSALIVTAPVPKFKP